MKTADLERPVRYLKNVGPQRAMLLSRLGIQTVKDLLYHFPRRYEDRQHLPGLGAVQPPATVTVMGQITWCEESKSRRGLHVLRAGLRDATGSLVAVWFNQKFLVSKMHPGRWLVVTGKVQEGRSGREIFVSEYEFVEGSDTLAANRIVPFYPATEGLSQRLLRGLIFSALQEYAGAIPDTLPRETSERHNFPSLSQALWHIHFPPDYLSLQRARQRLAFEEFFILQLSLAWHRRQVSTYLRGIQHRPDGELVRKFWASLPFTPTPAQQRVWAEIARDMESPYPMARLVQGDVGSGKTVLAAAALVKCVASSYQGAMMAPTEILAEQHWREFYRLLTPLGIRVDLLTGSLSTAAREATLQSLASGQTQVVVGTHALIQEDVEFRALGLAVTDEQHRFGVQQRSRLAAKGYRPDVLAMTATPIPRTLALTLYGDMDLSVIDELPPGRQEIVTRYVPERHRPRMYHFIRQEVGRGHQAYIVCPLIEESEAVEVQAVTTLYEKLRQVFPDLSLALLHGRLRPGEKEQVMASFASGETDILVATPVIEVGVNVPNATVMVIEGAERFGLSQLHQLRGRIGRGTAQSYCFLLGSLHTPEARRRIQIMTSTTDGFVIAEEDLRLRGPGEFFGTRQHGLPEFKVADLLNDYPLLEAAKREAALVMHRDPLLHDPANQGLRRQIENLSRSLEL